MDDLQDGYALGLDLGTTYSCIGVYRNGGVEIIPNKMGEKTTPSIVTIVDDKTILAGEETLEYLVKDYDSSIYAIKRFIGRKIADKDVKDEINKEHFPFNIVGDKEGKSPLVLVNKNKKDIKYTLEEISSFVIRKMVDSAEAFLGKKVNSLVITVPANFNDAQRKCTEQAAKLAGVKVLRIINEPTAAALAYGLGENTEKNENEKEKKILVFDLGGGTFDVTILKINKGGEQNFEIMSTKGDKFLGGEDFDNKLVEYFLDHFSKEIKEKKEIIKKDKKAIKKLKIACEKIKRVLSDSQETTLYLHNFYNNSDIMKTITRTEFENLCKDLFDRLKIPLDEALEDAHLTKNEIDEIVLVGGSSRIPKIKFFLQEYFNIPLNKSQTKGSNKIFINDTINPDEAVAYGATLMAAKILIKNDNNLAGFSLMDITPLSLGINVKNNSPDSEIQKEGDLMSIIIKRSTKIPFTQTKTYQTSQDNQSDVYINIFEGERKYTKYNHKLGNVELKEIPKKKKGEVKIDVKFFINVNGILEVTATEKSTGNTIKTDIKNDTVSLNDKDIERIREKNKQLYEKYNKNNNQTDKNIDYTNLKETLKDFQDSYKESEDDDDKYEILKNYNEALEEFINTFDQNFDNETMVEKYYIYVKELILSYIKVLNMKDQLTKGDEENIIANIQKYIKIFAKQSWGYLDNLIDILKETKRKKTFFEIIIIIIEELNLGGKQCLTERKKFCRYHSLMYFEKAKTIFKKYIIDFKNLGVCNKDIIARYRNQVALSESYIIDINSNAIVLCDSSLNLKSLLEANSNTQFTRSAQDLQISMEDEEEKYQIVLNNYEKMLIDLSDKVSTGKALCIAGILKIAIRYLGDSNYKKYMKLGQECEFIVNQLNIDKKEKWYLEFEEIFKEIKENYELLKESEREMRENIRKKYKEEFDEIDNKFVKRKNNLEFINYILKKKPYEGYEEDKKNSTINFKEESQELVKHLQAKYHPDNYSYNNDDEKSQLDYCLIEYIMSYLNKIFEKI